MTALELIKRLDGAKPSGENSWTCRCPAHEDSRASLSIKQEGEKVLLRCFAGCETTKVVEKLGLKMSDLFSSPRSSNGHSKIVAEYDYVDEHGNKLFQCVRFEPKDFRQRHMGIDGKWVWSLKGVRLVPYRLQECLGMAEFGQPIHVVEGEKDADLLWNMGYAATCNPMGAGKWRDEYSDVLRGTSRFHIFADDDKPGREHAVKVAESLSRICQDVRLGVFPQSNGHRVKDAGDWFANGGTKEKFEALIKDLPAFNKDDPFPTRSVLHDIFTVKQLISFDPDTDTNAIVGLKYGKTSRYLCRGYGAWFIGQSGLGKSSLAIQQAVLWCLGRPFFGVTPVRPLRVLFVESENDEGDMAEPVQGILNSIEITPKDVDAIGERLKIVRCRGLTGLAFFKWLEQQIIEHKADVAYVDPLLRFAGIEISRTEQCTILLNEWIDPVLARTGAALIGIHHTGKPKEESRGRGKGMTIYDYMYSGIGSSELVNWARAVSVIMPVSDGMFELKLAKRGKRAWATHLNGDATTSLFLKHHPDRVFWEQIDPPEQTTQELRPGGRPSQVDTIARMNLYSFCAACKPEGEGLNDVARRLSVWLAKEKVDASLSTCKRAVGALVANEKLKKNELLMYVKGPQA